MTRGFVRRLLAGLGLIVAGALLVALVYRPEMPPGARLAVAGAFAACIFGGLAIILAGWTGLACGVCCGVGIAMTYANQALEQPLSGLVTVAGLLILISAPMATGVPGRIRARFFKREKEPIRTPAQKPKATRPEEEIDALLLRSGLWIYQYLREGDRIYAARVLSIMDANSEKPLLTSAADYVPAKGSFVLDVADLAGVQRRMGTDGEYVRIRRRGGGSMPWCELVSGQGAEADAQLARVFAGIPVEWKAGKPPKRASAAGKRFFTGDRKAVYRRRTRTKKERRYEWLCRGLLAASLACQLMWLFVELDYRVLCAANLILALSLFLTYFHDIRVGIRGGKDARERRWVDRMLLPTMALVLRTLLDFNLDNALQLLAPALVLAALLALSALLVCGGVKRGLAGALACMTLLYAPAAAVQLNALLNDGRNAVKQPTPIVDMDVSEGSRSPTRYTLTLSVPGGERRVRVRQELYDALQVGGEVLLVTETGPLGIAYSYVNEVPEGGS